MHIGRSEFARRAAVVAGAVLVSQLAAACRDSQGVTNPSPLASRVAADRAAREPVPSAAERSGGEEHVLGTTPGWAEGKTVEFFYTKNFFCAEPPASGATSKCEVGEDGDVDPIPNTTFPVLYVLTPMGFTPPRETLHCPIVGSCVAHPSTIDLSRILGPGFANAPLPAHSHVIATIGDAPGQSSDEAEFWELEVIGVKSLQVWNAIARGRSLQTVRALQAAGQGITDDIPTNTYLFFGVRTRPARTTSTHP